MVFSVSVLVFRLSKRFYMLFNSLQVALLAVLGVSGISVAQIGLVLTYTSMYT